MSRLLLDDKPLIILPSLAVKIGLNEAIVIQQLHYWLQESKNIEDGEKWVYNTYDAWGEQFPFWSVSTIRRTITKLEKSGLIIIGNYNKLKIDNTKWYRIDYQLLDDVNRPPDQNEQTEGSDQNEQSICSNWTDGEINLNRPLPEITTENTTDIIPVGEDKPPEQQNEPDINVPDMQKATAIFFLGIGKKPQLSEDDKICLNMLFKIHTPAAIQQNILKSFERLKDKGSVKVEFDGKDYVISKPEKLPVRYIYNSMKNWSSLKNAGKGGAKGGQTRGNPNRKTKDYTKGAGPGFFTD